MQMHASRESGRFCHACGRLCWRGQRCARRGVDLVRRAIGGLRTCRARRRARCALMCREGWPPPSLCLPTAASAWGVSESGGGSWFGLVGPRAAARVPPRCCARRRPGAGPWSPDVCSTHTRASACSFGHLSDPARSGHLAWPRSAGAAHTQTCDANTSGPQKWHAHVIQAEAVSLSFIYVESLRSLSPALSLARPFIFISLALSHLLSVCICSFLRSLLLALSPQG